MPFLTVSDRRKLKAQANRLRPIVAEYDDNGIHDTIYHDDLARIEAALEKDRKGQRKRGNRSKDNGT